MLKSRFYINRLLFKVSFLVNLKNELRLPKTHFFYYNKYIAMKQVHQNINIFWHFQLFKGLF